MYAYSSSFPTLINDTLLLQKLTTKFILDTMMAVNIINISVGVSDERKTGVHGWL